jgi:LPXTG-motif cell wall-anchored protein
LEAPAGYDKLDEPITVTIGFDASKTDGNYWTYIVDGSEASRSLLSNGTLQMKVINQAGNHLPSTGGIGTTIFYITGSILMLAAAVLLISMRRMRRDEK